MVLTPRRRRERVKPTPTGCAPRIRLCTVGASRVGLVVVGVDNARAVAASVGRGDMVRTATTTTSTATIRTATRAHAPLHRTVFEE